MTKNVIEELRNPILTRLSMFRSGLHDDGPLSGKITFKGSLGEVVLTLNDETCNKVLALFSEGARTSVAEIADALRNQFPAARLTTQGTTP